MAVKKEADKHTGGDIKKPGPDNPGYSKGDSKDKDAFKEKNNIFNNQTIDQEAPKITDQEAKYGDVPFISNDDAKSLSDIRDKFAPNADKPTTASDTKSKKLPDMMQQVDPQGLAQMLPNMLQGMGGGGAGGVMDIAIPAQRVSVIADSFGGALCILSNKLGYEVVIKSAFTALKDNTIDTIIYPQYRSLVFNGLTRLIQNAILYGANNIPQSIYRKVTYGEFAPSPLVTPGEIPEMYTKVYYTVADDPWPGYIQWQSPDGTKSVYVKRGPTDYPVDSAYQELYTSAEISLAADMLPYVATDTLTADVINQLLQAQEQVTFTQGINISIGNGAGGGGGGAQQLLGMLMGIIEKFQNGQLMEGVLDQGKNREALKKYKDNMGALGKMEQKAGNAFGLGNLGEVGNLKNMLGQAKGMLGKGGGGGGGSGGGGQPSGGGSSQPSQPEPPLNKEEISNTEKLLNVLANTNPMSLT